MVFAPAAAVLEAKLRTWHPDWPPDLINDYVLQVWAVGGDELFTVFLQPFLDGDSDYRQYRDQAPSWQRALTSGTQRGWEHRHLSRWYLSPHIADVAHPGDPARADIRERTIDFIVDNIPWRVPQGAAKKELNARAEEQSISYDAAKRQVLRAAVALVLTRWEEGQFHRFGEKWVTGEDGKCVPILPSALDWLRCWQWLSDEVPKAAEAHLLDTPYPATPDDALDAPLVSKETTKVPLEAYPDDIDDSGRHGDAGPLLNLLSDEQHEERKAILEVVYALATPDERALLAALARQDAPDKRGAIAAVARELGISPEAARGRLYQLRRRLPKPI